MIGDLNTPLTSMESVDRSSRQKTNKETLVLKDTLYEMNLIDIQNILPKICRIYIFHKYTWNIHRVCWAMKQILTNLKEVKVM